MEFLKSNVLEPYGNLVKLYFMPEDESIIKNNKITEWWDQREEQAFFDKYKKSYLIEIYDSKGREFLIPSSKHFLEISLYFDDSRPAGLSKKGMSLVEKYLLNYNPSKKDIQMLKKIDIEFLLTEGETYERAQLLFNIDCYRKKDKI